MIEESKGASFMMTMMQVFKKAGQSTPDFAAEMRHLNQADKDWYRAALIAEGYKIV